MNRLVSLLSFLPIFSSQSSSTDSARNSQTPYRDTDICCETNCEDLSTRTEFGMISCHARGYPSHGGIVLGTFTGAELDWLGLSRSQPSNRSSDAREEDEFCYQMLRLGARWWKSNAYYDKRSDDVTGGYPWPECFPPRLHVGYPSSGGVWVLKVPNGEFGPEDFARVIMAFTMDERCAMLKEVGATFHASVEDCPDIPKSLEDGIAIGKRYEELMKEMMDSGLDPPNLRE